ncbi:MAG: hypothetical protein ACM3RP_05820 [Chitinophagales bacterium]
MASPHFRKHHLSKGAAYAGQKVASQTVSEGQLTGARPAPNAGGHLGRSLPAHLTVSPEELGYIGAELAKRLNFAAEEFLTELVAEQVRSSFRAELGVPAEEDEEF